MFLLSADGSLCWQWSPRWVSGQMCHAWALRKWAAFQQQRPHTRLCVCVCCAGVGRVLPIFIQTHTNTIFPSLLSPSLSLFHSVQFSELYYHALRKQTLNTQLSIRVWHRQKTSHHIHTQTLHWTLHNNLTDRNNLLYLSLSLSLSHTHTHRSNFTIFYV